MATVMGLNLSNKFMSNPIPLSGAVPEIKGLGINSIKLFDWDKVDRNFAMSAAQAGFRVAIGIPNHRLADLSTEAGARTLFGEIAKACSYGPDPNTLLENLSWICVGNEPFLSSYRDQYLNVLGNAVQNIAKVLSDKGNKAGVTIPQNFEFMAGNSWPPSTGRVQDKYKEVIKATCAVMKKTRAPFMVNIYPFLSRKKNPKDIKLDYAMFTKTTPDFTDPNSGKSYFNLFDAMFDALHCALNDIGYGDLEIVIGECGWPTAGDQEATQANAQTFLTNLIAHCKSGKGTPMRPNKTIQCFAFEMYDEDNKNIGPGAFEHYWGVYDGRGNPKFPSIKW